MHGLRVGYQPGGRARSLPENADLENQRAAKTVRQARRSFYWRAPVAGVFLHRRSAHRAKKSLRGGGASSRPLVDSFEAMTPLHILVAEDNPADVTWLKITLDQMGLDYRLTLAQDGEQARDYLLGRKPVAKPDLVMLDVNLPRLTGIEVLQSLPPTEKLPVCFVTGSQIERRFVLNHFERAVVTYITKPVDREKILDCLRSYDDLRPLAERLERNKS
jgi:CheY-like chemotaxis protein